MATTNTTTENTGQSKVATAPVDVIQKDPIKMVVVDSAGITQLSELLGQKARPIITTINNSESATSVPSVLSMAKTTNPLFSGGGGGGGGAQEEATDQQAEDMGVSKFKPSLLVIVLFGVGLYLFFKKPKK